MKVTCAVALVLMLGGCAQARSIVANPQCVLFCSATTTQSNQADDPQKKEKPP